MGMRVRLKADYDISGFAPEVQVILRGLKKYGMILADNGSDNFISGAPDRAGTPDVLRQLKRVTTKDLEVVEMRDWWSTGAGRAARRARKRPSAWAISRALIPEE